MGNLGKAVSIQDSAFVGSKLSVMDGMEIASSLSVRGLRVAGGHLLSALAFFDMGSALSLRNYSRCGSALSVGSPVKGLSAVLCGFACSVCDTLSIGSSLSVRGVTSRMEMAMSVVEAADFGSSLSLRSVGRCGSSLSLAGLQRFLRN
jgi:hypothetical protein